MKTLIFLLILMPVICYSQDKVIKSVSLSFQPADFGTGLMVAYRIGNLGVYNSASYGNNGVYRAFNLKNHIKLTAGVLVPLKHELFEYNVLVGLNYHYLSSAMIGNEMVEAKVFNPLSFELGIMVYVKKFAFSLRTDILRWEPCIDIGLKF